MTTDGISMQQHVTEQELWFWTLPVLQVSGAVSCPAAPWPHLASSICALSATFCHSAPTPATPFIFVRHGIKRERSMSEVKDFKRTPPHITGENRHFEVSPYWIPKWMTLSAIKVKTVKCKSALLNYMAIESSSSVSPLSPEAAGGITVSGGPTAVCQGNSEDN